MPTPETTVADVLRILDSVESILVFQKDAHGRFEYVNRALARLFGMERHQIIGKTDRDLNPNVHEVAKFEADDRQVLLGTQVKHMFYLAKRLPPCSVLDIDEEPLTDYEGCTHILATHKERVDRPNKEPVLVGVSVDVSEFAQAKSEAMRASELLRSLLDCTHDEIYVKDIATEKIVTLNQAMAVAVKLSGPEKGIGQLQSDVLSSDPLRLERDLAGEAQAIKSRDTVTRCDWVKPSGRGGTILQLTRYVPVHAGGKPSRIVVITSHSSDPPTGSINLKEIFDTLPQCIFFKDTEFKFRSWNRSFSEWHRLAVGIDEFDGLTDFDLWTHDSDQAQKYRRDDTDVIRKGISRGPILERQQFRDGSVREIQTRKFPVRDRDGVTVGVLGIFEDLTSQQRAEANELVQNMSRRITHALGSWLDALQINCKIQIRESGQTAALSRLSKGLKYLEQLLAIMTGVASLVRDDFQAVDMAALVVDSVDLKADPRISVEMQGEVPSVFGSHLHLSMILNELLGNAARFAKERIGINLTFAPIPGTSAEAVQVTVGDDGAGVSKSLLPRLFLPGVTSDRKNHTGMGLAYVYEVVRLHEGTISHSIGGRFGMGSHFVIRLPFLQPHESRGFQ